MQTLSFRAFGCAINAVWNADALPPDAAELPALFEAWEQILSRFRPDSELMQLNEQAGEAVAVSSVLWQVLQVAAQAAAQSEGLVSPMLLPALVAAGYDAPFEPAIRDKPPETGIHGDSPLGVANGQITSRPYGLRFDGVKQTVTLPQGAQVEVGGIAKGWVADWLAAQGGNCPFLIDVGGDIAVSGLQRDGKAWPIAVADPRSADAPALALLMVRHGGVATSGQDYRYWYRNGQRQHHIINPRTGQPAQTDVLAATVLAHTAVAAEVAAKVVLIKGSVEGLRWIEAHPGYAALVVRTNGMVQPSTRWEANCWPQIL